MASTNTFGEVVPAAAQGVGQTCPDAVESQPIAPTEWFWPGWIQRGQLNIIVGDQDAWVSTVAINLIADMSRGSAMPDGQTIETVHTLYWTNERFGSETVKPRLAAAQAADELVQVFETWSTGRHRRPFRPDFDTDFVLHLFLNHREVKLLVIGDFALSDGHADLWDGSGARHFEDLLAECRRQGITVICISRAPIHGAEDTDAYLRAMDSLGIKTKPASLLVCARCQDGGRVLTRASNPEGRVEGGIRYEVIFDHPGTRYPRISWGPRVEGSAMLPKPHPPKRTSAARVLPEQWLDVRLRGGPVPIRQIWDESREAGYARTNIVLAKKRGGIRSVRDPDDGTWHWANPARREAE